MESNWDLTAVVQGCNNHPKILSFVPPHLPPLNQPQHQNMSTTHINETHDHSYYNSNNIVQQSKKLLFSYKNKPNNYEMVLMTIPDDDFGAQQQAQLLRRQQQQVMQMQYSYYQNYFDQPVVTRTTSDNIVLQDFQRPALQPRSVPQGHDPSHYNISVNNNVTCVQNLNMQVSLVNNKPNKKKNQVKKAILTVTKENLCSDIWSWRKYGQKPIKGSLYPRSYYRCSSVKGCSARRQMERSHKNPQYYILTYTGEHSHPPPEDCNSYEKRTAATNTDQNNELIMDELDDLLMPDFDLFDDSFIDFLINL